METGKWKLCILNNEKVFRRILKRLMQKSNIFFNLSFSIDFSKLTKNRTRFDY